MKFKILALLFALVFALTAGAESYTVYAVHGRVLEKTSKGETPITARDTHLTDNSTIVIEKGGSLTLHATASRRLVTVKEVGQQRLSTLVARSDSRHKSAAKWISALIASLMRSETPEYTGRKVLQSQGATHRGDDTEQMTANAFAAYLEGHASPAADISMRFIDEAGNPIAGDILAWDDIAVAEVSNLSEDYLFVNLIAISPDGSRSLVFPVDTDITNNSCAHLCIPPLSTVRLTELAFFPSMTEAGSRLVLAASPEEINFTVLCDTTARYNPSKPTGPLRFAGI